MRTNHLLRFAVIFLASTAAALASAQPLEETRATAEKLFEEASQLMGKRDFETACPKLEEVVRLQPQGIGAKLSLADCYVGEGKLASAYLTLGQAADAATRANQEDRANVARERARSIEPRLSKIMIIVPDELAALPGLTVSRNGVALSLADLKQAAPVNRGSYGIVATAAGRRRFEKTLTVADEGTSLTATISLPLEQPRIAPPPSAQPPAEAVSSPWSAPRIAGVVIGVAGLGLVGVGIGFGMDGVSRMDTAAEAHKMGIENDDEVQQRGALKESAAGEEEATAGWVLVGVGGALTVAGVLLAILAPSAEPDNPHTIRVTPWLGGSGMGATVLGKW